MSYALNTHSGNSSRDGLANLKFEGLDKVVTIKYNPNDPTVAKKGIVNKNNLPLS